MTAEQVEDFIEAYIATLKPEIRDRFVYIFRDFDLNTTPAIYGQPRRWLYGVCNAYMRPPLVTFFPDVMAKFRLPESEIRSVVDHEMLHTFNMTHEEIAKHDHAGKFAS